jgi:hypothetical protein
MQERFEGGFFIHEFQNGFGLFKGRERHPFKDRKVRDRIRTGCYRVSVTGARRTICTGLEGATSLFMP